MNKMSQQIHNLEYMINFWEKSALSFALSVKQVCTLPQ